VIFSIFSNKDFSSLSDEKLMLHIANGNSEAFTEIYNRYSLKLLRYFYRLLGNNLGKAEDFTQDLFIKVMQASTSFNADKKFSAWLYTMANNMCRNEWRDQSNRNTILNKITFESIEHQNFHQKIDQKLLLQKLETEIQQLPELDQTLIAMRYQQELSIAEIAAIIDVPEGTVKSKLFYIMKKLSLKLKVYSPHIQ
jgi:RNA polymerase sigma-70 factor (ECF subfamily)